MNREDILFAVAAGMSHDSEYDGINDNYCSFCGCNNSRDDDHEEDCLMLQARECLGDKYQERLLKNQLENDLKQKAHHKTTWDYQVEKVSCPLCGKRVARIGLSQHKKSEGCKSKEQTA